MSKKDSESFLLPNEFYVVSREDSVRDLVDRNVQVVQEAFAKDPENVLVSVQIEEDQVDHLEKGLMGRSRRLIPLPLLAKLIHKLNHNS